MSRADSHETDNADISCAQSHDESDRLMRGIEALLMAAEAPLAIDQLLGLLEAFESVDRDRIKQALDRLEHAYRDSAADLVEVAGGWRFQVGSAYSALVARLWEERPPKLSRAMLETLAIICYRQPLARSDIEAIRGVSVSSNIIKTLSEYEWIKIIGHREVPGRPALYGTTPRFLDDFGVKRLTDLPDLPQIKDLDALDEAVAELRRDADGSYDAASSGEDDTPSGAGVMSDSDADSTDPEPPNEAPRGLE